MLTFKFTSDKPGKWTIHKALQNMPIVAEWIAQDEIVPDDVATLCIDNNLRRDYEEEKRTESEWALRKFGDEVTVTLTLKSGEERRHDFPREAWQDQNKEKYGL